MSEENTVNPDNTSTGPNDRNRPLTSHSHQPKLAPHELAPHDYESICRNATGAFFVTNDCQHCTYVNPAGETLTGYRFAELAEQPLYEKLRLTGTAGASTESAFQRACLEGRSLRGEDFLVDKNGAVHPIIFSIHPIYDGDKATGSLIELYSLEKEHRARRYLQLLNEAAVAITAAPTLELALDAVTDRARLIIGAHQCITSVTRKQDWEKAVNAVSLSEKYAPWRNYKTKPEGSGIYMQVCLRNRPMRLTQAELEAHPAWRGFGRHAAEHPPMRGWMAVPLVARNGDNLGLIQLTDKYEGEFTEEDESLLIQLAGLASIAIENAALYQEAQEANRLKDEFLATMSHELRTPLMAIVGWTHLLQTKQLDEESAERALETIMRNSQAQRELIEDLLDVSRIITGKLILDVQNVDPNEIVKGAIDSLRPAIEAKFVQVQTVFDPGGQPISGDPARLQQIVWNLLSNAIKFTPRGGDITIRLWRTESSMEIIVSDTGQGIETEFLPYVFDRFRQSDQKSTRRHGGLGLGLAIVRHLVELHGGTIEVSSDGPGTGATFTVQLPLSLVAETAESPTNDPADAADAPRPSEVSLHGTTVLVVDDEADNRDMIRVILQRFGARVVVAPSAQEGLKLLVAEKPDVLVSDIGMPIVDGYTFIREVRMLGAEGTLPAVALTAYARAEDRERALAAGFQIYLTKPVDPTELATVVETLARKAQER